MVENPDGQWTARDFDAGVSAQGATREEALGNLDAVVDLSMEGVATSRRTMRSKRSESIQTLRGAKVRNSRTRWSKAW